MRLDAGGANMQKSRVYIVFGIEHYNHLGMIRSLGESGIAPVAIIIRQRPAIASKSKYISKLYLVDSVEEGYRILLEQYGSFDKENLPVVLTGDDLLTSYLDERYEEIKDKFLFYNAGTAGRITRFMNKDAINDLARKHGLNVAKTWRVPRGEIPDTVEYPIITKAISSNSGGWKNDVFICHSKSELEDAYTKIKSEEVLLQKYIEKKNELCLDGVCVNKGKDVFVSMASSYKYILPDRYSFYMYFYPFTDDKTLEKIVGMMSEIGFEGIFTIEFLIDKDDALWFMEVNFRNSGWSYASTCWGMNLPLIWAESMQNQKIPETARKTIPENATAIVELTDFSTRVLQQKMNPFKWFSECRSCECRYLYNKQDPKPFWSALFGTVRRKLSAKKYV